MNKKEIVYIGFILVLAIGIAFYPNYKSYFTRNSMETSIETNPTAKKENYIIITLKGDLKVDKVELKIPYGYTFGNILPYVQQYANEYSDLSYDRTIRFDKDTCIEIKSLDPNCFTEDSSEEKVNINTASRKELISLYGIGEKRSEKIIEYRLSKKISSFNELKELLGVSNEVMEKLKEQAIL